MRLALWASLVLLAAMAWPMARGRVHTHDDLGGFHLPLRAFYAERLGRGEPWDWMPQLFGGFYVTGEGQLGAYHPLHLVLYRGLPLPAAFELELLLSYPFMFVGAWLWLRRRLGPSEAAMLGALVWTFSSFNLLRFVHPNAVAVTAHVGWLLWAIDLAVAERGTGPSGSKERGRSALAPRLALIAVALLTGSQLLLGYPQYVWFSLLVEAGWATILLWQRRYRVAATALWLVWAKIVGLLLAAVQVLPTIDALAHSTRMAAGPQAAEVGAVDPLDLVQVVGPYLFRDRACQFPAHEFPLYFGAVPLMLAAWLLSRRSRWGAMRAWILAAAALAAAAGILSLGRAGILGWILESAPVVGTFRCPARYLVLAHLAVAALAAMAFVRLSKFRRARRESFRLLWTILALSVAAATWALVARHRLPIAAPKYVLAGPVLLAIAAWLVARAERGARWALGALVLLAAADQGAYGLGYAIWRHTHPLAEFIDLAARAPIPEPVACPAGADLHPDQPTLGAENAIVLAGWRRMDGYAGLEPMRRLDYLRLETLRVAGVHWVRVNRRTLQIPGLIDRGHSWLAVPDPMPRIRLVNRTCRSSDPARDLRRLPLESTALVEEDLRLESPAGGKSSVVSQRPGRLELDTACPGPQLLVLAEGFDRGWRAWVEGQPRPVMRVNGDFLGCLIGPGNQRVVLEFQPSSLRIGWNVSRLGLVLLVAWGIWAICSGLLSPQKGGLNRPRGALY